MELIELIASFVALIIGILLIVFTLRSAIRTFVLPRSAPDRITRFWFRKMRTLFNVALKRTVTYEQIDSILAMYAPVTLVALPFLWLGLVLFGYSLVYWGLNLHPDNVSHFSIEAYFYNLRLSGSSLLTLGIVSIEGIGNSLIVFSEAAIGLVMVALLIAYLPTLYSAFSKREALVTMLEVRAGSPPRPAELFRRIFRFAGVEELHKLWQDWEIWFTELEETHTSLPMLAFFRSQQPSRSWVTAAGLVLDSAALQLSTMELENNGYAPLCIRAGFLALQRICGFFGISFDPTPSPTAPISITREEFEEVFEELAALNLFRMKSDRDQAWRDYSGWRVNYDTVLIALAELTSAPYAPWSSDRGLIAQRPALFAPHNKPTEPAPELAAT